MDQVASPLTGPPQAPPPDVELTAKVVPEEVTQAQREVREQLADGAGARADPGCTASLSSPFAEDVSEIVTERSTLPRSSLDMRLLAIRDDPLAYFLPTKTTTPGTSLYVTPPGLVPEPADMFIRPVTNPSAERGQVMRCIS